MENSNISWTTHTFNPWIGCQKVSPGCDNCYAETLMDTRFGRVQWGPDGERKLTSDANWRKPLAWNSRAAKNGERPRVFCASLADVFDNQVPQEWRERLWDLISDTPHLDWLLLTKRPKNFATMLPASWLNQPMRNVWLGISAENQKEYDRRWPILDDTPAVRRFVSAEPLLEHIDLLNDWRVPDWVICGGESGPEYRPMDKRWATSMRRQCDRYDIAFWFKQHAGLKPGVDDLLDGVRYHELPRVQTTGYTVELGTRGSAKSLPLFP